MNAGWRKRTWASDVGNEAAAGETALGAPPDAGVTDGRLSN